MLSDHKFESRILPTNALTISINEGKTLAYYCLGTI